MARVKGAMMTRKRRNKILKLAKGYWGAKSKHYKMANQAVMKSGVYAYKGRKLKKRDFRQLWITRINAACKLNGMNYSTFMNGLTIFCHNNNSRSIFIQSIYNSYNKIFVFSFHVIYDCSRKIVCIMRT